ncbi:MAG: autotransporter-associated beta strand repeat-containing protein [Kiritimatiellaeota bacterium]|nr:autotransporter-associated beta strand repeat-containing protein [Kiritimatiellota bacterium]
MKHLFTVFAALGFGLSCAHAQIPVLTYNGAFGGDWFASGVWLDEQGQSVDWADGSVAVITNTSLNNANINLSADAVVHGFCVTISYRTYINGNGKLTLGAGGIVADMGGEFNIQSEGGLHLAASQEWFSATGSMFCLDGRRAITSAPGVVLTVNNGQLRANAGGGLTDQCTIIIVGERGSISPSPSGELGTNKLIFEGPGTRYNSTGDNPAFIGEPSTGSELLLNNGASFNVGGTKEYRLPLLTVASPTGTVASAITGGDLSLTNAETVLHIEADAELNISARLADGPAGASAVRKTGAGALLFTREQLFSGGLAVDTGDVAVSVANGLGAGAVTLASGIALELLPGASVANAIGGAGAVVKTGAGAATLTGVSTYTGGTDIQDGTVRVNALAAFGGGTVALNGNTIAFVNNITLTAAAVFPKVPGAGVLKAEANTTLTWADDYAAAQALRLEADLLGNVVVTGSLTGAGFVKTDPGKLSLSDVTGYTGVIRVENGILYIGDTSVLTGDVTIETADSGAVQLDSIMGQNLALITGTANIVFADGAAITLDTDMVAAPSVVLNETLVISDLSGAGDLVKIGPGTMVVTNAPNFTGRVFVLDGTLVAETPLGQQTITVSNGTFRVNNATLANNPLALLEATAVLAVTNSGSLGAGALAVNVGRLRIEAGGTVGTRAVTVSGTGRVLVADGAGFDNGLLTIGGGSSTLEFIASTVMTKAPVIAGNCWFYAPPGIEAEINQPVNTSAKAKLIVNGGGRITFSGGGDFAHASEIFVQQSGTEFVVVSNKVTISWYAGLEVGGKLILVKDGGEIEITGGSASAVHVGANQTGTSTIEVGEGGTLNILNGTNFRLGYNANAIGVLRISGGTAYLPDNNIFGVGDNTGATGRVEIVSGTLHTSRPIRRNNDGNGTVIFSGGTLQSDGVNSPDPWIADNIPVIVEAGGGTIDVNGLEMTIGASAITGPGTLTVTGNGIAHFDRPAPDWTGGAAIDNCTLRASATSALGTGVVDIGDGTLDITDDALLPNAIRADGGNLHVGEGLTAHTGIALSGRITKTGPGEWVADALFDDADLSIADGQVTVAPFAEALEGLAVAAGAPAAFWVDATVAASLAANGSGQVSRWFDRRTPGDLNGFYASQMYNAPVLTPAQLNGLPVVDFGNLGQDGQANDNRPMVFKDYLDNIRTVFWVIGSKNGGGFLLGDSKEVGGARHFHRAAGSGLYGGNPSDPLWRWQDPSKNAAPNGETWINKEPVDGTVTGLSGDFDLVAWRLSETDDTNDSAAGAMWFAACYAPNTGRLNGGQDLGEVLIFTNRLTDAELRLAEYYLARKWFPHLAQMPAARSVSLDTEGVAFVNAHTDTLRVSELIINAANVTVGGPIAAAKLTVTANGALQCERLQTLETAALELEDGATILIDATLLGDYPALMVTGDVTLPQNAAFRFIGSPKPPPSVLLVRATGTVNGAALWQAPPGPSRIEVKGADIWLKTAQGTIIILK